VVTEAVDCQGRIKHRFSDHLHDRFLVQKPGLELMVKIARER